MTARRIVKVFVLLVWVAFVIAITHVPIFTSYGKFQLIGIGIAVASTIFFFEGFFSEMAKDIDKKKKPQ